MPASRPALWERAFPGDDSAQEMLRLAQGLVDVARTPTCPHAVRSGCGTSMRPSRLSSPADPARRRSHNPTGKRAPHRPTPLTVGAEPSRLDPHRLHPMDSNTTSLSAPGPGARGPHDPPRCLPDTRESAKWTVWGCLSAWREAVVSPRWEGRCGPAPGGCGAMVVGGGLVVRRRFCVAGRLVVGRCPRCRPGRRGLPARR